MRFVIKVLGFANGAPCKVVDQYLMTFDFEADGGVGYGVFTDDPKLAMSFESALAALKFWRTQSKTVPFRESDGGPNRPLTSSTVEIVQL